MKFRPEPPAGALRLLAKVPSASLRWLGYAALAVGFYLLVVQLEPERQLEPASGSSIHQ